jgi:HAD superfamily hydrolase (TIGR01662 family)
VSTRPPLDVDAVVCDVGEVLIDETRVWDVWADLLGVTRLVFGAALGATIVAGREHDAVFSVVAPDVDWRTLETVHERRYGGFDERDLYPDVRPTLATLRALGITVVVAGNQPARRREQLVALDLPADTIATSDDLGVAKPAPTFFARVCALARAATPERVLYVGDRIDNDIVPAGRAGLRTAWLRRGPWGLLQRPPAATQPDLVLATLRDLPAQLAPRG